MCLLQLYRLLNQMKTPICVIIFAFFLATFEHTAALAEVVVIHADTAWERTDIILEESRTLTWHVKEDDYWSFNTELFPEGHNAEGIPVPALETYALPGGNIGMLLGKIGDGRIITMGVSGSAIIGPGEGGNYLYLTINDDLFGKYGKGFKDNIGEILVTITQDPMKILEISILFIEGCPGYEFTKRYINEIISEDATDFDVKINMILIESDEDARRLHFIGSPSVRVEGLDIEESFIESKDYAMRSRLYNFEGKPYAYPTKGMIRNAIRKAKLLKEKKPF